MPNNDNIGTSLEDETEETAMTETQRRSFGRHRTFDLPRQDPPAWFTEFVERTDAAFANVERSLDEVRSRRRRARHKSSDADDREPEHQCGTYAPFFGKGPLGAQNWQHRDSLAAMNKSNRQRAHDFE